ncbi:MAG: hypothetical protein ACPGQL_07605 [Thermoplasmatota archaeon]
MDAPASRFVVPVSRAAWLSGDLGHAMERQLVHALDALPGSHVQRLPRAFLVQAEEEAGPLLEALKHALEELERAIAGRYPVFYHEMGPVWTGTIQAVFTEDAKREVAATSL